MSDKVLGQEEKPKMIKNLVLSSGNSVCWEDTVKVWTDKC
jgi:hypothetical protein